VGNPPQLGSLDRKRVLVVGASSGIGRAIAIRAVRSGARVALAARRADLLNSAVEEAVDLSSADPPSAGPSSEDPSSADRARAFVCDTADEQAARAMVDLAVAWLGGLDVVVYAAGTAPLGPVAELTGDVWARLLATNVIGAAVVVARALPELRRAENGTVSLLSSHTVGGPWPMLSAYSASKAALEEYARGLRLEEPGVRVVTVKVGNIATQFADGWDPVIFDRALGSWVEGGFMRHRVLTSEEAAQQILSSIVDRAGPSEILVRGEDESERQLPSH
jgi:NAD(P)-dependent dehydrogenase (short-subunit alcohol dehydrogenase family)